MDGRAAGGSAWDTPIEVTLSRYLDAIARDPATEARLRAALRAEPIARGCPSLAMITPLDLLGLRAHLELHGTAEIEAVLDALTAFLSWAREQGAHSLPAGVVERSLRPPEV
jgi:hypothetical protein